MQLAVAGVPRNDAATGHMHGLAGRALLEHQQHVVARDVVRRQPGVAVDRLQFENAFIERLGALHVLRVNASLQNAVEFRHDRS